VLSGNTPPVQRGAQSSEKMIEGVFSKKPVKVQEGSGTTKTVQKTAGKMVDATAVHPKPVTGSATESAIPVVGQVTATVVPQGEISQTDVSSKVASPATKPAAGISPVAIEAQARKNIASGAKTTVTDSAMTVTAGNDPVASPKPDIGADKAPASTIPGGSDGQNKSQAVREPAAALVHSPGIATAAVVSGNTPGELVATKLPAGDAGAYAGGLTAGSREHDGPGVVASSMDGAPRMLTATPTSLEVGIQNGTHGWLKVRAEMTDGGVVNASVSAASSAGQEMLHRELPGLTAYLQQEKVAVNAVIVHASSAAGVDARSSSGTDDAGGQTPQRSNQEEPQHQSLRKTTLNGSDEAVSYGGLHEVDEDGSLPLARYVNGGSWLSVRA
jgi:hypothetical protein